MTELKKFLNENGKLIAFPAKRRMKLYALYYLALKFEPERIYSESEINDILDEWHVFHDPATLRRELFDYHLLDRSRDGRTYNAVNPLPEMQSLLVRYL